MNALCYQLERSILHVNDIDNYSDDHDQLSFTNIGICTNLQNISHHNDGTQVPVNDMLIIYIVMIMAN